MRITEGMLADNFLGDYEKIMTKRAKEQIQVASNSRIQTLSDDVNGTLQSISLKSQISKTDTFIKNANHAYSFLQSSLNALDSITTDVQNIMTTASSAENPSNVDNYATMAQSMKDALASIVQSVNTKENDMYIFGGTNYKGDPVSIVSNRAVPTTEDLSGEVKAQISQSVNVSINVPGSKIINSGVFQAINNIIDTLESGQPPTDAEKTALKDSYNKLVDIQSLTGLNQNRVDNMTSILNNQSTNYQDLLSKIQSVDTAKLATDLQTQDYLLQVINQLLASTMSKTVFDYV
jgi:flagellar hook-associated protein 3 FlgL